MGVAVSRVLGPAAHFSSKYKDNLQSNTLVTAYEDRVALAVISDIRQRTWTLHTVIAVATLLLSLFFVL